MAIQTSTVAVFDSMLHQYYGDGRALVIADAWENKLLTAIPKASTARGKAWNLGVPLEQVSSAGGSYDAKNFGRAGIDVEFSGKYKDRWGFVSLDQKTIEMSVSPDGAYDEALPMKIKSCDSNFKASTNYQLFRTEDGDLARLASFGGNDVVATGTLSANTQETAQMRLKTGATVQFSSARGGTVRAGYWIVDSIQDAGVLGIHAAASGAAAPVAGDYVYLATDARNNSTSAATTASLAGVESWVPGTQAEASTDFKGVPRGLYGPSASGIRLDATGKRATEAIQLAGIRMRQRGAKMGVVYMHPTRFFEVVSTLQGQQRFVQGNSGGVKLSKSQAARFGFDAVEAPGGVAIIDDWACQFAFSWGLDMKSWLFETRGGFPHNRGEGTDGLKILRSQSDSSYLYEIVGYGELKCYAPGHNVCIIHSTAA